MKTLMKGFLLTALLFFLSQPLPAQMEELIYDTGVFNGILANQNPPPGQTVGIFVRFTPSQIPAQLKSFKVFLQAIHPDPQEQNFTIYVYNDNEGAPEFLDSLVASASDTGWVEIDLENLNISLTGEFLIGIIHHHVNEISGMVFPWIGLSCFGESCCTNFERSGLLVNADSVLFDNPNFVFFSRSIQGCIGMRTVLSYESVATQHLNNGMPTFYLHQNYPNPFEQFASIEFGLLKKENVSLKIFSSQGNIIKTLFNDGLSQGNYTVQWDGKDENGVIQPDGIYFYSLIVDNRIVETKKMVFTKQ